MGRTQARAIYLAGSFGQDLVQSHHLLLVLLRWQLEHGNANNFSGHDCGAVLGCNASRRGDGERFV